MAVIISCSPPAGCARARCTRACAGSPAPAATRPAAQPPPQHLQGAQAEDCVRITGQARRRQSGFKRCAGHSRRASSRQFPCLATPPAHSHITSQAATMSKGGLRAAASSPQLCSSTWMAQPAVHGGQAGHETKVPWAGAWVLRVLPGPHPATAPRPYVVPPNPDPPLASAFLRSSGRLGARSVATTLPAPSLARTRPGRPQPADRSRHRLPATALACRSKSLASTMDESHTAGQAAAAEFRLQCWCQLVIPLAAPLACGRVPEHPCAHRPGQHPPVEAKPCSLKRCWCTVSLTSSPPGSRMGCRYGRSKRTLSGRCSRFHALRGSGLRVAGHEDRDAQRQDSLPRTCVARGVRVGGHEGGDAQKQHGQASECQRMPEHVSSSGWRHPAVAGAWHGIGTRGAA